MAEKNRRGEEPADNDLDELFDDEDETVDDGGDADDGPVSRRGGTATRERTKASADDRPSRERREGRGGPFGFIGRFVREVIAELRKVIWPTRNELLTYTAVVVVFLTVMTAIVVGLDYVFAEVMLFVFGDPN